MATPPTFVSSGQSAWNNTSTPKTVSVTVQTGDILVIAAATDASGTTLDTPTGNSLTYVPEESIEVANFAFVYLWTAVATGNATFNVSIAKNAGTENWGFAVMVWRGSDGIGASSKTNVTSGAPSLSLTTTTDNAAIVCFNADFAARDGVSRVWRTINSITPTAGNGRERVYYVTVGSDYGIYYGYWEDAGTAGANTTGMTIPNNQKYSIVSIEVKGAAGGTNATINASTIAATAALPSATKSAGSTVSPSRIASTAAFPSATKSAGSTVTPAVVAATATMPAGGARAGSTVSPAAVAAVAGLPAAAVQAGGSATVTPATIATSATLPAPAPAAGSTVTPGTLAAVAALPAPAPAGGAAVTPGTVAVVAALPSPVVQTGDGSGHVVYTRLGGALLPVSIRGSVRVGGAPVAFG